MEVRVLVDLRQLGNSAVVAFEPMPVVLDNDRARQMISPVTVAFNIGGRPTATYSPGLSTGIANRGAFRWMAE